MPTGFTCIVEDSDETTFEQYLWRCARGMGAFVSQRDSDLDAKVPLERVPEPYYFESVGTARKALQELETLTIDEAAHAMEAENREREATQKRYDAERLKKTERYDRMRQKVLAWRPPTPEHKNLKKFMLDQLETGWPDYLRKPDAPVKRETDPRKWLAERIARAKQRLERAEEDLEKEIERCRKVTDWIQALHKQHPWVQQP